MTADELFAEGWRYVMAGKLPPLNETVEFAHDERVYKGLPWFGKWGDLSPHFNAAGLWWRPVDEALKD